MKFIVERIKLAKDTGGVEAGREKYRAFFIHTTIYKKYRTATDMQLKTDGYGDCVVTE